MHTLTDLDERVKALKLESDLDARWSELDADQPDAVEELPPLRRLLASAIVRLGLRIDPDVVEELNATKDAA